jgi:hypothetical protein
MAAGNSQKAPMASIAKRPDGQWRARYRDDAGREHAKHFRRRVDAQRWLDEVTTAVVTGTYADPKAGKITSGRSMPDGRSGKSGSRQPWSPWISLPAVSLSVI